MANFLKLGGLLCLAASLSVPALAQAYAVGADVSFLGKCEQDGLVFKEGNQPRDVLAILHDHQYNWVRLRIFHDPSASADKLPNDLGITESTVKCHVSVILMRLNVSDRTQAVVTALRRGLVHL